MTDYGYDTLYGTSSFEGWAIDPNCHMSPYEPDLRLPLACCLVHRVLHHNSRNCHFCDPAVMEQFGQAVKVFFGESGQRYTVKQFGCRVEPLPEEEPMEDLEPGVVSRLREAFAADFLKGMEFRDRPNVYRTLADLGGTPNPSGAVDLGSRWRPKKWYLGNCWRSKTGCVRTAGSSGSPTKERPSR